MSTGTFKQGERVAIKSTGRKATLLGFYEEDWARVKYANDPPGEALVPTEELEKLSLDEKYVDGWLKFKIKDRVRRIGSSLEGTINGGFTKGLNGEWDAAVMWDTDQEERVYLDQLEHVAEFLQPSQQVRGRWSAEPAEVVEVRDAQVKVRWVNGEQDWVPAHTLVTGVAVDRDQR